MNNPIGIVFVSYKDKNLVTNIKQIVDDFRKFFFGKLIITIIENHHELSYSVDSLEKIRHHNRNIELHLLLGSNGIHREFLSYDIGVNYFDKKIKINKNSNLFILNSTFLTSDIKEEIFENIENNLMIPPNTMMGHLDDYPVAPKLNGHDLNWWIRSNAFFAKLSTFIDCGSFCPDNKLITDILDLSPNPENLILKESPYHNQLYKEYVETWLLNKFTIEEFDQRWETTKTKSIYKDAYNSKSKYIQKTWTILIEHLWSQKLAQKGIDIINTSIKKQS